MPLSENEQRILDELEKQLRADDPTLATTFSEPARPALNTRRLIVGGIAIVVGLGLLIFAVSLPAIWLGVLAFLLMVAGAVFAISNDSRPEPATDDPRRQHPSWAGSKNGKNKKGAKQGGAAGSQGFMKKMEERWERRSNGDR